MHLSDDLCLIESDVLAPPIVSTFNYSSTRPEGDEHRSMYELSEVLHVIYRSWNYNQNPLLAEKPWKNSPLVMSQ